MQEMEQEIATLEQQLNESIAAERFFETETGRLWADISNKKINLILKDITSEKFVKDHQGYLNALAELRAYKKILNVMTMKASPKAKAIIKEKLEAYAPAKPKSK